ncbi:hypothetical protein [Streptomyces violaceusniger]|uniref:hypothetical protein n=1 Tax=Streptomyces violaceusniger TaxID=68280 RepID=UPI00131E158E|nr:hypothetical protein [Streptomyces hygroscopicus]
MASIAAITVLLAAGVMAGAALAAPGSGLGVRTEGAATGAGSAVPPHGSPGISDRAAEQTSIEKAVPRQTLAKDQ